MNNLRRSPQWLISLLLMEVAVLIGLTVSAAPFAAAKKQPPTPSPVYAGYRLQDLYPGLAEDLGLPREARGVLINAIFQDLPAHQAGLREGDLIVRMRDAQGKMVEVENYQKYSAVIGPIPAEKPLVVTVSREGKELTVELTRTTNQPSALVQPPAAAAPRLIKVAADGSGDCKSLDGAMLRSRPGDTILLSPGNYPALTFSRNNLTVISVDLKQPAVLAGVSIENLTGINLKGVTVYSGKNSGYAAGLAGVWIKSAQQIVADGCLIQGFEHGVFIDKTSQEITVSGNILIGNSWGIVNAAPAADGTAGSGNYLARFTRNLIVKNFRGGIDAAGPVEITNNTIIQNVVANDYFVGEYYKGNLWGMGIAIESGNPLIFNNILASNNIGCLIRPGSQATLEYNAFYQQRIDPKNWSPRNKVEVVFKGGDSHVLSQIKQEYTPAPVFPIFNNPYSDRYVYTPEVQFQVSTTNIIANPMFVDTVGGDYRLAADSTLTNKGRNGSYIGAYQPLGGSKTGAAISAGPGAPPKFGVGVRGLNALDQKNLGLNSLEGLLVTEVKKDSLAEKMQLQVNDVILAVNGKTFTDLAEFKKLIETTEITSVKLYRHGTVVELTVPVVL